MSRFFRVSLALSFVLGVASTGFAQEPSTDGQESNLRITVRVYNYAQVPQGSLARAERKATRVFRKIGEETVWLNCPLDKAKYDEVPECLERFGSTDLGLRISPRFKAELLPVPRSAFGWALLTSEGGRGSDASIFYHRVKKLSQRGAFSLSMILGHVMAHEVGHLLLRTVNHSRKGIMRAHWKPKDLHRAAMGDLEFTPQQAERIRSEVVDRMRASDAPELARPRSPK